MFTGGTDSFRTGGNAQRHTAKQMVKEFLGPLQQAAQTVSELVARRR
jgi:IclR family transcriptional regulator, pca regulon regulatory protein